MQGASRDSLAAVQEAFDATVRDAGGDLAAVADDLFGVVGVLADQAALRRALSDPALPGERKRALVTSLLGERISAGAAAVLGDVVGRRWSAPADLADAVEVLAAQAAFAAAEQQGRLDDVEDELFRFERVVEAQPALRAALTDPGLGADRKTAVVHALLEGRAAPTTLQVLDYILTRPRGRTFEDAIQLFSRLAAARRQRLIAQVTSAVALDPGQQQRLAAALTRIYGREVHLQVETDPDLIGGVVVRVGDEIIDGSVVKRLSEARRRLAG